MKSALTVVLFRLFTIGVFVDGKEESVSVTEGNSVTLKSGFTEIQTDDEIEWWFSERQIAKISRDSSEISVWVEPDGSFRDRLQLDNQTGDLKISNIRTTDSGDYKLFITSPRPPPPEMTFTVKVVSAVVSAAAAKPVSLLVGDSVTLQTGLTDIQRDAVIQWRYGQQKSPVAEINRKAGIFNTYDGPDERFRDRLQLDHQTESLIIKNIGTTHSGLYEVEIISTSSRHTIHHTQSFNVTVRDALKSVSVKEGETVTLQTDVTEIQKDDLILWMFGDTVLAEINKTDQRFYTSKGPDESFRNRLKLDKQTGSLTIRDTRTTDSGLYELKISSSRHSINRRFIVFVTDALKSVSVKEGETVTLQTNVTEIQKDDLIQWMFGDTVLAEINKTDQRFYTSKGPNESFRDRLQLDHQTGSLIITDTRTTDSGLYEVKISSSRHSINRRFVVFVTAVPESAQFRAGIGGGFGGVLLCVVGAGVIYYCYKKCKSNEENPTLNGAQDTGDALMKRLN